MQLMTLKRPSGGFSMVEILVTIVISTIGLVGLATLQLQTVKSTADTGSRSQAIWVLEDIGNRIRANSESADDYDTAGAAIDCTGNQPKMCSAYYSGSARVDADLTCSGSEQAQSDLWEVACSHAAVVDDLVTKSAPVDFLANPELIVSVASGAVTATVSWDVRTSGTDADGNTTYTTTDTTEALRSSLTRVYYP